MDDFRSAAEDFEKIGTYKDCTDRAKTCRKKEEERRTEEERLQREAYLRSERLRKQKNKKIAIIASAAAVIAIAAFFVNDKIIQPSLKYEEAQSLIAESNYADAYLILNELRGYKDVDQLLGIGDPEYAIGSEIQFGSYEQDGNTGNGAEDIEWIILARAGDNALLLSKYGLDAKEYHEEQEDITWEQSDIRSWLNSSFMDTAFTSEEQGAILKSEVDNSQAEGNSEYDTTGGNNTEDRVFLLSYKEAFEDYFSSDEERVCMPTDYAVQNGAYINDDTGVCWWWLRGSYWINTADFGDLGSLFGVQIFAANVSDLGSSGYSIVNGSVCIRPALWVNLESDIF